MNEMHMLRIYEMQKYPHLVFVYSFRVHLYFDFIVFLIFWNLYFNIWKFNYREKNRWRKQYKRKQKQWSKRKLTKKAEQINTENLPHSRFSSLVSPCH